MSRYRGTGRRRRRNPYGSPDIPEELVLRPESEAGTVLDASIRIRHLRYLIEMLKHYQLNQNIMHAVLKNMDARERQELVDAVYDPDACDEDGELLPDYEEACDEINDPPGLCSKILQCLLADKLKIDEKALTQMLMSMLQNKLTVTDPGDSGFEKRLGSLGDIFRFSSEELELVAAAFAVFEINSSVFKDILSNSEFNEFIRFFSVITGIDAIHVRKLLNRQGRIYRSGIIDKIDMERTDIIDFEERISEYLSGIGDVSLTERFVKKDRGAVLPIDYFDMKDDEIRIITRLLEDDKPCNILLAGVAGTGKTAFARSIGRAVGRPVFTLNVGGTERNKAMSLKHDEENSLYLSLRAAEELVHAAGGILIADEMDVVLNRSEKGWLNLFLDSSIAKIIWITNELYAVEESTMRRFQYARNFERFTSRDRMKVWENVLEESPYREYFTEGDIRELSREYNVNAGGIAAAVHVVSRLVEHDKADREVILGNVRHILQNHEKQISKDFSPKREKLHRIDSAYDISVLNCSVDPVKTSRAVSSFGKKIMAGENGDLNMNILLSGIPGTGKTEYVKYLARESGLELLVRRYSDLESMYVGQAEKNIAAAFREAENDRSILFIDEADSFFTSRDGANRSWEVSRTNEFLTQMENHRGILICSTNLLPSLDNAAMRRFQWKIEFLPLREEDRVGLYRKYFFFIKKKLTAGLEGRIRHIDGLTPGDMKAVQRRIKMMDEGNTGHDTVISALEEEQRYKGMGKTGRVGF